MIIYILGCGPAGLLAAHACQERGHDVTILSRKVQSTIPGAVFLHEHIPDLVPEIPDGYVKFFKEGTKQGYAKKVYGSEDAECSWDIFPQGERPAWSMFILYNGLWGIYRDKIIDFEMTPGAIRFFEFQADLVISTIPANVICERPVEHTFDSQGIHVLDKTADPSLDNGIVYNGDPADFWYRTSRIFTHEATESTTPFPGDFIAALGAKLTMGFKPLRTNCDCHPGVARVGRFGRWEKGVLVHHAYKQTVQLLEELS